MLTDTYYLTSRSRETQSRLDTYYLTNTTVDSEKFLVGIIGTVHVFLDRDVKYMCSWIGT